MILLFETYRLVHYIETQKKLILNLFTFLLIFSFGHCVYGQNNLRYRKIKQEEPVRLFRFGFLGGPVVSQLDGDGYTGFSKFGCNAGIKGEAYINRNFIFEINLTYTLAGSKIPPESPQNRITDGNRIIRMNFAEVPFIMNYRLPHKKYPLNLELGAGIQQLLDYRVNEDLFSANIKSFEVISDQLNKRNYMMIAGIERFYKNLTLALRANFSLGYQYYNEQYYIDVKNRVSVKNQIPLLRSYYLSFVAGYTLFGT
jgi:hypothetical protein